MVWPATVTFLLLVTAIVMAKGRPWNPAFAVPVIGALYSSGAIFAAFAAGKIPSAQFPPDLVQQAAWYGTASTGAILVGAFFGNVVPVVKWPTLRFCNMVPGRGRLTLFMALGTLGAITTMVYLGGSVSHFLENLDLRQYWSVGKSWILIFVIPIKTAALLAFYRMLINSDRHHVNAGKLRVLAVTLLAVALLGVTMGRRFSIILVFQIFLLLIVWRRVRLKHVVLMAIVVFVLLFGYGAFRYAQGVGQQASVWQTTASLLLDPQRLLQISITIFFDSWYTLLEFMKVCNIYNIYSNGILTLAAPLKLVPGFYSHVWNSTGILANVSHPEVMRFRAIPYSAIAYADFRYFAVVAFIIIGFLPVYAYRYMLRFRREIGFIGFCIPTTLYAYSLMLLRSGLASAFVWMTVDLFWIMLSTVTLRQVIAANTKKLTVLDAETQ